MKQLGIQLNFQYYKTVTKLFRELKFLSEPRPISYIFCAECGIMLEFKVVKHRKRKK